MALARTTVRLSISAGFFNIFGNVNKCSRNVSQLYAHKEIRNSKFIQKPTVVTVCSRGLMNNNGVEPTKSNDKESELKLQLNVLDLKWKNFGQLSLNDISKLLRILEGNDIDESDVNSIQLLEYAESALQEEFRPCNSIMKRLWEQIIMAEGCTVTCKHLEIFLRMCLKCQIGFDIKEFSSVMDKHSVKATAELFEMMALVHGYQGDLKAVMEVITIMKEKNIALNESIFSALILAHGKEGDTSSIQSVLDAIKSVQITPTNITYGAMMTAFAMTGKMESIKLLEHDMEKNKIVLSPSQYIMVLQCLVKHGHSGESMENINFILGKLPIHIIEKEISHLILHLIHCNFAHEAVFLMLTLPSTKVNTHLASNGALYIKEMVRAQLDHNLIISICEDLRTSGINTYALHVALESALRDSRKDTAWILLQALKKNNDPIRQHYFWPLLLEGALNNSYIDIIKTVEGMITLGEPPNHGTLKDYVIPGLPINQPLNTLQMLKEAGLSVSQIATPLVIVLIMNKMLNEALQLVTEKKTRYMLASLTYPLAVSWYTSPTQTIAILKELLNHEDESDSSSEERDWVGQFVLDVAATKTFEARIVPPLFRELKKSGLGISGTSADMLLNRVDENAQKMIHNNLSSVLTSSAGVPPRERESSGMPHPREMNVEELEDHLHELESKGMNTRGVLRRLLFAHASANNSLRVAEIFQKFESGHYAVTAGMLASLLSIFIRCGNIEGSLEILHRLQKDFPSFDIDYFKYIDLCTLLLQHNQTKDALKILEAASPKKKYPKRGIQRNCVNLLGAASTISYSLTKEIFDLLRTRDLVDHNVLVLGSLIKAKLSEGDLEGAITEAKHVKAKYNCLPSRIEVLVCLLRHREVTKNVDDLLQKMMDLIVEDRGTIQARHDLLFACLESGKSNEARKVLQSMKNFSPDLIEKQCSRYDSLSHETALTTFLSASRNIPLLDRNPLYNALLNVYYKRGDAQKGLALWTSMQEEDVNPTEAFLSKLANLLSARNLKIPFQIS